MASSESFRIAASTDDLMTLSPNFIGFEENEPEMKRDFLTDTEFDSICDATIREATIQDNMFMDTSSLDYLSKCTDTSKTIIDRGKDSLFVKFDPLYARNIQTNYQEKSHDDIETDIGYETCSNNSVLVDNIEANSKSSIPGFSTCGSDKPMQAVYPVMCREPVKLSQTQTVLTPTLLRSVSAILTPTQVRPERLINFYGNTNPLATLSHYPQIKYGTSEINHSILQTQDQELLQAMQEKNELEFILQSTKEDFKNKITKLTGEVDCLKKREHKLMQQVNDKNLGNKQMAIVMDEYEKTISMLIDERQKFATEKEQALNHLAIMESSFNDLLTKYEKCKVVINEFKDNQNALIQEIAERERDLKHYDSLYNSFKKLTTDNLNKANETLKNVNKSHNIEITKLNAIIKKYEITISSLQESLTQKTRDIEELTSICDQLINQVH